MSQAPEKVSENKEDLYSLEYDDDVDLDYKDKRILKELQVNGRKKISEIARSTGLSRDVVQYRMEKLEENDVIRFYHAFLNPAKLGYPLYTYAMLRINSVPVEQEDEFVSYLTNQDKIIYVGKLSGTWDYGLMMCGENFRDIDDIINDIRHSHPDVVKDFERGTIVEEYKYDFMADLIETDRE